MPNDKRGLLRSRASRIRAFLNEIWERAKRRWFFWEGIWGNPLFSQKEGRPSRSWTPVERRYEIALLLLLFAVSVHAAPLTGTVHSTDDTPLPFTYVGLMTSGFAPVGNALTGADGAFSISQDARDGFLVVQPAAKENAQGLHVHAYQPRIYAITSESANLELRLPPAVSLVLEAYDANGTLMRWEDFEALGKHGGQFMYATNLDDEAIAAACWPVHGKLTGASSGPREKGLPAVLVEPGQAACVSVLFWPTAGYGKLMLRADNAGGGYQGAAAGDTRLLHLNLELARTAVAQLTDRKAQYAPAATEPIEKLEAALTQAAAIEDHAECAAAADTVLADALRLRDALELERARAAIPEVRRGSIEVRLENAGDVDYSECTIEVTQRNHDFLFGVFEGSPYNARAFELAREAGFEYATVLPGWNWTQNPKLNKSAIDRTFGIPALEKLGYRIKAHGVVWMQGYGILPDDAKAMKHDALCKAVLDHQRSLLEVFAEDIDIWEAMNEPANTNVVDLPREDMVALLTTAARSIAEAGKPSLVNSPHEFSYGAKYLIHETDNTPQDGYPMTYSAFLRTTGAAKAVDIVGLQFYPGFHLNDDFGGQQGPAFTPAHLLDTIDRYTRFDKALHITELSMPSSYEDGWYSGYWREPWNEATQADYAEAVYTLAFAHPQVQSVGWWDVMDTKPSVVTGGLVHKDGTPKPVFERLRDLIAQWTTQAARSPNEEGRAVFEAYGGDYTVTLTLPDGAELVREVHVLERWTREITINLGDGS